jgi:hypothetical protein
MARVPISARQSGPAPETELASLASLTACLIHPFEILQAQLTRFSASDSSLGRLLDPQAVGFTSDLTPLESICVLERHCMVQLCLATTQGQPLLELACLLVLRPGYCIGGHSNRLAQYCLLRGLLQSQLGYDATATRIQHDQTWEYDGSKLCCIAEPVMLTCRRFAARLPLPESHDSHTESRSLGFGFYTANRTAAENLWSCTLETLNYAPLLFLTAARMTAAEKWGIFVNRIVTDHDHA